MFPKMLDRASGRDEERGGHASGSHLRWWEAGAGGGGMVGTERHNSGVRILTSSLQIA